MKETTWKKLATVLVVVVLVLAGTALALVIVYTGRLPPPRWYQVFSYTYPVTISSWDEDSLTWNSMTPEPEIVHRFNITGYNWRIFVGGSANDTAEKPVLHLALFALYPNGSFQDAIPLDFILLKDLSPFGWEIRDRTDAGSFQLFLFGVNLERYGITVTEWR